MSVEIEGMDKILADLEKLANAEGIENAVEKSCALVEASAKRKAPKGSGALRRSIESKVENKDTEIEGTIFTPLEYAPYIEFGTGLYAEKGGRKDVPWKYKADNGKWYTTSGQKPQPYLRPALKENTKKIINMIKGALLND